MNIELRTLLESSPLFSHFSEEEIMLLFSLWYEGTFDALQLAFDEKIHDGKCSKEESDQILAQFSMIQKKIHNGFDTYTHTVNDAYHQSFCQIINEEYQQQQNRLKTLQSEANALGI